MTTDTPAITTDTDSAQKKSIFVRVGPRLRDFFVDVVLQARVLKKAYPGVMHALIFWGVTIQIIGTAINLMQMELFVPFVELAFPRDGGYLLYELVMDLAGLAIVVGALMAAYRRLAQRPKTLESRWDDYYAIAILLIIPLIGFSLEGLRFVATAPAWANWSPVGNLVAALFRGFGLSPETAMNIHTLFWWTHMIAGLVFVASIPFTKLRHLVTGPLNIVLRPRRKAGVLEKIEDIEEVEILGVGQVSEFHSQQLLSFDACVNCGRCEEVCPATNSGMAFSPRALIQSLHEVMVDKLVGANGANGDSEAGSLIADLGEEMLWCCTTCGACLMQCPMHINPVSEVIDLRRYQTLTTGEMPGSVGTVLRNMERQGNPWGIADDRAAWAEGLDVRVLEPGEQVDVLFFTGCALAYDDRSRKAAQAFTRLMQEADVDFAILGEAESCCGETARRLGHEYLFQVMAEQNVETLAEYKFNRIVTQCTHCFNTLKNEFPQFGGTYEVQHYTELLAEIAPRLSLTQSNGQSIEGNVTFHDPCYLGRYNGVYDEPRSLLDLAGVSTVEMEQQGENSFCCGGGGGQMWLETDADTRINNRRLGDALDVQASIVATACPYCLLMFDDAIRSQGLEDRIQVMGVAEVLASQLANTPQSDA